MGVECVRSSSPINHWLHHVQTTRGSLSNRTLDDSRLTCLDYNNINDMMLACRRASSFPLVQSTALPSLLKVRSQSESAGLNSINIKVPRNLLQDMCRQKLHCSDTGPSCCSSTGISFYTPSQNEIQSDSEGDDSLVSSEEGGSSLSSAECNVHNYEDDLGVVRDLDLYEEHNDRQYPSVMTSSASATSIKTLKKSNSKLSLLSDILSSKKEVRFADECGGDLEDIRVMTEPSDYPPFINPAVLRRYRKAALASISVASSSLSSSPPNEEGEDDEDAYASKPLRSTWKITFKQPASEYFKFRETLEQQKVALENLMLKNDLGRMMGTIKVANIAFEKRVFIRFTSDKWKSYLDRPATFQSSPSHTFDTFRFDIDIPRDTDQYCCIEFCVCFIANNSNEYWDSNGGRNFILTASAYEQSLPSPIPLSPMPSVKSLSPLSCSPTLMRDDAYRMDYSNWTNFASWRNLRTDTPYW